MEREFRDFQRCGEGRIRSYCSLVLEFAVVFVC